MCINSSRRFHWIWKNTWWRVAFAISRGAMLILLLWKQPLCLPHHSRIWSIGALLSLLPNIGKHKPLVTGLGHYWGCCGLRNRMISLWVWISRRSRTDHMFTVPGLSWGSFPQGETREGKPCQFCEWYQDQAFWHLGIGNESFLCLSFICFFEISPCSLLLLFFLLW